MIELYYTHPNLPDQEPNKNLEFFSNLGFITYDNAEDNTNLLIDLSSGTDGLEYSSLILTVIKTGGDDEKTDGVFGQFYSHI